MSAAGPVLVLGGTGFVGRLVCEKLVAAGHRVTVPTRRAVNARNVQALPLVTVLEANVHDPAALAKLLPGHSAVVNLVAILQGTPAAFEHAHVRLPTQLASACKAAGIGRLVHVSALGVGEAAPSQYLRSKWQGEQALAAARLAELAELAIVRPSVIFGAGDKLLNLFAKLQRIFPVVPLAGADAQFQPVWVADVAEILVKLATCSCADWLCCYKNSGKLPNGVSGPLVVEAAGPRVLTLRELVEFAGAAVGAQRPIVALPNAVAQLQARLMELAPGEPLMSRDNLASMQVPNVATGKHLALRDFGIEPASLEAVVPTYLR
jgi:uncharacterized protein YbjT (DUF2867 family)